MLLTRSHPLSPAPHILSVKLEITDNTLGNTISTWYMIQVHETNTSYKYPESQSIFINSTSSIYNLFQLDNSTTMFALLALTALVSCSLAQPWYAAGYCADTTDQCTTDAWRNDCSWNNSVRRQCAATCGLCTGAGYYGLGAYGYGYAVPAVAYVAPVYPVCTDAIEECASYVR